MLIIEGKTNKLGNNLEYTTVTICKGEGDDQSIVAHGMHTKYISRDTRKTSKASGAAPYSKLS